MLTDDFIASYADKPVPWDDLGHIVYKRTYARPILDEQGNLLRHEEWHETVGRVVNGAQAIGAGLTEDEERRLFEYMFNLKGLVGGRMLWQLGTPNVERFKAASLTNCWFTRLDTPEDFGWLFDMLMLGGGVGYSVASPENLGIVRAGSIIHADGPAADFIVPDTREGWVELLVKALRAFLGDARDAAHFSYSTHLVRPAGAPIKTFGGTASGPGILIEGIEQIAELLSAAEGRYLTSTEVLDIANIIGSIVVSGNVRRSAQIALGSPTDGGYLQAKRWDTGSVPAHRAMSNNSVYVTSTDELGPDFWFGYETQGEPYGMFNLQASRAFGRTGDYLPDPSVEGTNPCGEISLAHRESCNLAELVLPRIDSAEEMFDVAKLLYKVQKAVAALGYVDPQSDAITKQNMRLGLGVTGVAMALDKVDWLEPTYLKLRRFDREWSAERGLNPSVRLTTVKPSGTLSLLAGVTPGGHPGFAPFLIRRVRMAANDPLVLFCEERGYHIEPQVNLDGTVDGRTMVVAFPQSFPVDTLFESEMSAVQQLDMQRFLQAEWADNAVSVTVYIKEGELPQVQSYLARHWHQMKSVSFLHPVHGFKQMPLEAISEGTHNAMVAGIKSWQQWSDSDDFTLEGLECEGGACPVR